MNRQDEWTRESEAEALARMRAVTGGSQSPIVLLYTRQSVSDFDADGRPRGPSLNQQLDTVTRRTNCMGSPLSTFRTLTDLARRPPNAPGTSH